MLRIEGYTREEILGLTGPELDELVLHGEPIVLRIGSADVLGAFSLHEDTLQLELAQIDGGGEGALPLLAATARSLAKQRGCTRLEWTVHAVNCAQPNLKLKQVLERRGFRVSESHVGLAYLLTENL